MRIVFMILFLTAFNAVAQVPPGIDDSIMNIKGNWSIRSAVYPAPNQSRPANLFPLLNKKVDSIAAIFRQAYPNLRGTNAFWYSSLDEGVLYNGAPWSYAYRSGFMYYYYNTAAKKIIPTGETGTWAYAFVNRVFWLFDQTQMNIEADGQTRAVWLFPHEKGEWNGHTLYEPVTHGGQNASAIMLTKNGRLPYKPVSQLQYLQSLRKIREKEKQESNAKVDKSLAQVLQKQNEFWDKELKTIDDYISNTDKATLAQQAIVTNWRIFKGSFPTLKEKNAFKLVYIDPEYFNSKLPSYTPQFIVVYWRWNNNAPGRYFKQQLEQHFRADRLKAMIRE